MRDRNDLLAKVRKNYGKEVISPFMNSKNTWSVRIPKRVGKILSKFPKQDQERIFEILRDFEIDPWVGDIVKIKGEENKWRHRIGNYRIFYSVYIDSKLIDITEIERRTSTTY